MSNNDDLFNFASIPNGQGDFEFDFSNVDFNFGNAETDYTFEYGDEGQTGNDGNQEEASVTSNGGSNFNMFANQTDCQEDNKEERDNITRVNEQVNDKIKDDDCFDIFNGQENKPDDDRGNTSVCNNKVGDSLNDELNLNSSEVQVNHSDDATGSLNEVGELTETDDRSETLDTGKKNCCAGDVMWKEINREVKTGFLGTGDESLVVKQSLDDQHADNSPCCDQNLTNHEISGEMEQESLDASKQSKSNISIFKQHSSYVAETETNASEGSSIFDTSTSVNSVSFSFGDEMETVFTQESQISQKNIAEADEQHHFDPFAKFFNKNNNEEYAQTVPDTVSTVNASIDQLSTSDTGIIRLNEESHATHDKNNEIMNEFTSFLEHRDDFDYHASEKVENSNLNDKSNQIDDLCNIENQNPLKDSLRSFIDSNTTDENLHSTTSDEARTDIASFQYPPQDEHINNDDVDKSQNRTIDHLNGVHTEKVQWDHDVESALSHSSTDANDPSPANQHSSTESDFKTNDDHFNISSDTDFHSNTNSIFNQSECSTRVVFGMPIS